MRLEYAALHTLAQGDEFTPIGHHGEFAVLIETTGRRDFTTGE